MAEVATLKEQFEEAKAKNLALDMTRGKPGSEQLDLTLPMLDLVTSSDYKTAAGADSRNYGGLDGIPEAKELFKDFLEAKCPFPIFPKQCDFSINFRLFGLSP